MKLGQTGFNVDELLKKCSSAGNMENTSCG